MVHPIFVCIIFLNIFINGCFGESIFCYHGESYDTLATNISTINCPSGKCLMFSSACSTYWATTCYNERKPMALTAAFKNIRKYFNISTIASRMFSYCNLPACNYNNLSPFLKPIFKDPISFDYLLWPNSLKKETPRNTLRNGIKFRNDLVANEIFEFIGQTFNNSRKIWIKYDFSGLNNTIITYRFDLNLSESFYFLKTIIKSPIKNAALQNTLISSTEKRALKIPTKPGEKLIFALSKNVYGKFQEIRINLSNISLPMDLQKVLQIQYGGNWIAASAKSINAYSLSFTTGINPYDMNPTFDIPKPSTFNCSFNSSRNIESAINSTLKYSYIGNRFTSYRMFIGTPTPKAPQLTTPTTTRSLQSNFVTPTTTRSPIYQSYYATTLNSYVTTPSPLLGPYKIERVLLQKESIEYEIRENLCANSNLIKIQIEALNSGGNKTNYSFTIWRRLNSTWTFLENMKMDTELCGNNGNYTMLFFTDAFSFLCNNIEIYYSYVSYVVLNYVVEGIPQKLVCNK